MTLSPHPHHPDTEKQALHPREAWLFANAEALKSVLRGIEQAGRGELYDLGSFKPELGRRLNLDLRLSGSKRRGSK